MRIDFCLLAVSSVHEADARALIWVAELPKAPFLALLLHRWHGLRLGVADGDRRAAGSDAAGRHQVRAAASTTRCRSVELRPSPPPPSLPSGLRSPEPRYRQSHHLTPTAPGAPVATTWTLVTPVGTTKVPSEPVGSKVQVVVRPPHGQGRLRGLRRLLNRRAGRSW